MQFIEQIIHNPNKINEYIHKLNSTKTGQLNSDAIFIYSLFFNSIALNIKFLNEIGKDRRITFLNRCLGVNRLTFGLLLKKGKESYEKAMKADSITNSIETKQKEIDKIQLFLSNEGNNNTYKFINDYISRGIVHFFDSINDKDFKNIVDKALFFDEDFELNYLEIRNWLYKQIHSINFGLNSKSTQQHLQFFNNAIPIKDINYMCFYKPFFLALQDYCNYLLHRDDDNSIKEDNSTFAVIEDDFRDGYSGRLSYDDIVEQKRFKYMEELLFDDGIIDAGYNFIEARGNKKAIAATIKFMFYEKYFRKNNYKQRRDFEFYQFRQYLDHRYSTNTTETMKKMTDNKVKLHFQSKQWKFDLKKLVNTDFFSLNTL